MSTVTGGLERHQRRKFSPGRGAESSATECPCVEGEVAQAENIHRFPGRDQWPGWKGLEDKIRDKEVWGEACGWTSRSGHELQFGEPRFRQKPRQRPDYRRGAAG